MSSLYKIPRELLVMSSELQKNCKTQQIATLAKDINEILARLKDNNTYFGIFRNFSDLNDSSRSIIKRIKTLEVTDADTRDDIHLLANFFSAVSNLHGNKKFVGTVLEKDSYTINLFGTEHNAELKNYSAGLSTRIANKVAQFDEQAKSTLPIIDSKNKDNIPSSETISIRAPTNPSYSNSYSDSNEEPHEIYHQKKTTKDKVKDKLKESKLKFLELFTNIGSLLEEFRQPTAVIQHNNQKVEPVITQQEPSKEKTKVQKQSSNTILNNEVGHNTKPFTAKSCVMKESLKEIKELKEGLEEKIKETVKNNDLSVNVDDLNLNHAFEENPYLQQNSNKENKNLIAPSAKKNESVDVSTWIFIAVCIAVPVLGWIILITAAVYKAMESSAEEKLQNRSLSPGMQ